MPMARTAPAAVVALNRVRILISRSISAVWLWPQRYVGDVPDDVLAITQGHVQKGSERAQDFRLTPERSMAVVASEVRKRWGRLPPA